MKRNHPRESPDTGLMRQTLYINCLKYAQRAKVNYGQRTKGNQNADSPNRDYQE